MAGDRTIAPTAARVARAWREGLRPAHRWLGAAAAVWGVTLVIPRVAARPDVIDALRDELAAPGLADVAVLEPVIVSALVVALGVAVAVVGAAVVTSVGVGTAGPRAHRTVEVAPRQRVLESLWLPMALATAAGFVAVSLGVVAGAARAPGATESGLQELWATWAVRIGAVAGALLLCAGLAELAVERWRIVRRLHASPEQLREERARRGDGRR
jgi:hypothetical protein